MRWCAEDLGWVAALAARYRYSTEPLLLTFPSASMKGNGAFGSHTVRCALDLPVGTVTALLNTYGARTGSREQAHQAGTSPSFSLILSVKFSGILVNSGF